MTRHLQHEAEIERIAMSENPLGPPILTDVGREQLRLYPELLAALRWFTTRATCDMSQGEAAKVAYGFLDVADAAIAKAESL